MPVYHPLINNMQTKIMAKKKTKNIHTQQVQNNNNKILLLIYYATYDVIVIEMAVLGSFFFPFFLCAGCVRLPRLVYGFCLEILFINRILYGKEKNESKYK